MICKKIELQEIIILAAHKYSEDKPLLGA